MRDSIERIFPAFYDAQQTRSSVEYLGRPDDQLIDDGTYLMVEDGGELVACGGWSRRDKLFSGSSEQEGRVRLLDPGHRAGTCAGDVRASRSTPDEDWGRSSWRPARRLPGMRASDACR